MEESYFFMPKDWNLEKEFAVLEVNDFMERYLSDLNLRSISNSFKEIVELEEPTYLSGYTSVKTWIKFWEYYNSCEKMKLSNAKNHPELPPDFPPLDYYTLNKIVFHYLLDVNLVEEARTFALHTSDDTPDGIDFVDYTVVDSVREFIVPFTAYISEYSPNSEPGNSFLLPSSKEDEDECITEEQTLPEAELTGQHKEMEQQSRPPNPPGFKLKPLHLLPCLDQLIDVNVKSLLPPDELMTLTGEPKPSVVAPIRPEARQSFPNNDALIDTILSSIQPDLGYVPQQAVPSSYSSLTLTGEHKPPEVTQQLQPSRTPPPPKPPRPPRPPRPPNPPRPPLPPKPHRPPRPPKPPRPPLPPEPSQPSPHLDQLIDANVMSLIPTELDCVTLPVEIISSDPLLRLTGEQKLSELTEQPDSPLPQPSPQHESSLEGLTEDYSTSDFDEHLPPSKIRKGDK